MSIKKVFFDFSFMKVTSGRLEGIVLSVIMLPFQYSLKLSFSSTLAGVYNQSINQSINQSLLLLLLLLMLGPPALRADIFARL